MSGALVVPSSSVHMQLLNVSSLGFAPFISTALLPMTADYVIR